MRKLFLVFTAFILLLVFAFTTSSCGAQKQEGNAEQNQGTSSTSSTTTTGSTQEITARQALETIKEAAAGWASDAVPYSVDSESRGEVISNGVCDYWFASFYSPSKKEAWGFYYFQGKVSQVGSPAFQNVQWQVGDLEGNWKVDSPEAAATTGKAGMAEIANMAVSLRQYRPENSGPQAVPSSCPVYWEIEGKDGKTLYINAVTGEVIGWQETFH